MTRNDTVIESRERNARPEIQLKETLRTHWLIMTTKTETVTDQGHDVCKRQFRQTIERDIGDRVQSLAGVKAVQRRTAEDLSRQNPSCTDRTKAALMQSRESHRFY